MYGAIIGDIAGSKYEFDCMKTKEFPFITEGCTYTDDTNMTVAVARALLNGCDFTREMQALGRQYPYPQGGYGGRFSAWLHAARPEPYHSYGNGAAMRVSPCGLIAVTLQEALALARASAEVTHDHPEGIRGAQAAAGAVFLAKSGKSKAEIREYIDSTFYPLDRSLDEIRPVYSFNETCQKTVPEAIQAFLESTSYEDAVRNAISLGGDSDTIAAITGSIAWSYYRVNPPESSGDSGAERKDWPEWCGLTLREHRINEMLPDDFVTVIREFEKKRTEREDAFRRTGTCGGIGQR